MSLFVKKSQLSVLALAMVLGACSKSVNNPEGWQKKDILKHSCKSPLAPLAVDTNNFEVVDAELPVAEVATGTSNNEITIVKNCDDLFMSYKGPGAVQGIGGPITSVTVDEISFSGTETATGEKSTIVIKKQVVEEASGGKANAAKTNDVKLKLAKNTDMVQDADMITITITAVATAESNEDEDMGIAIDTQTKDPSSPDPKTSEGQSSLEIKARLKKK